MKSYARIASGRVAEIVSLPDDVPVAEAFHPDLLFVEVTAAAPQPEQGWTFDGQAFAAPAAPTPSPEQLLAEKLAAGLSIISTGTPSLNATYALDADEQMRVANVALYVQVNQRLPGGLASVTLRTVDGGRVSIGSAASFLAIATAIGDRVAQLQATAENLAAGEAAAWPADPVTIA